MQSREPRKRFLRAAPVKTLRANLSIWLMTNEMAEPDRTLITAQRDAPPQVRRPFTLRSYGSYLRMVQ